MVSVSARVKSRQPCRSKTDVLPFFPALPLSALEVLLDDIEAFRLLPVILEETNGALEYASMFTFTFTFTHTQIKVSFLVGPCTITQRPAVASTTHTHERRMANPKGRKLTVTTTQAHFIFFLGLPSASILQS